MAVVDTGNGGREDDAGTGSLLVNTWQTANGLLMLYASGLHWPSPAVIVVTLVEPWWHPCISAC